MGFFSNIVRGIKIFIIDMLLLVVGIFLGDGIIKIKSTRAVKLIPATWETYGKHQGFRAGDKFYPADASSVYQFKGGRVGVVIEDVESMVDPIAVEMTKADAHYGDDDEFPEEVKIPSSVVMDYSHLNSFVPFNISLTDLTAIEQEIKASQAEKQNEDSLASQALDFGKVVVALLLGWFFGSETAGGNNGTTTPNPNDTTGPVPVGDIAATAGNNIVDVGTQAAAFTLHNADVVMDVVVALV